LIIRLESARDERLTWEESLALGPAELGAAQVLDLSPVQVRGEVTFAAPDFVLKTEIRFELTVACDRCAKPVKQAIESGGSLVVSTRPGRVRQSGEVALREEDLGWLEIDGEALDTGPLVREQALLEIPTRPLCREDCAGLCPRCGADLNEGACDCAEEGADPRWGAALEALKKRLSEGA